MKNKKIFKLLPYIIICATIILCTLTVPYIISIITKHTHEFGEWESYKEPTCATLGYDIRFCTCGAEDTKTIDRLDHTKGQWIIDKDSNEKKLHCAVCDKVLKIESLEDHTHSFGDWTVKIEATCTTGGIMSRSCICGWTEEKAISTLKHSFGNWETVTEPSCDNFGIESRSCACGKTEQRYTHKTEHNYSIVTTYPSTCTEAGMKICVCLICNNEITEELTAIPHKWGEWTITDQADCIHDGLKVRSCTYGCGTVDQEIIYKTPDVHQFGPWETIKQATETEFGIEQQVCSICNDTKTRQIDKLKPSQNVWNIENGVLLGVTTNLSGSITIPSSVTTIGERVFEEQNISSVMMPWGVTTISSYAFAYCENLSSITIPSSVTLIKANVFTGCGVSGTLVINYDGTIQQWQSIAKHSWNTNLFNYIVKCSDGEITPSNNKNGR